MRWRRVRPSVRQPHRQGMARSAGLWPAAARPCALRRLSRSPAPPRTAPRRSSPARAGPRPRAPGRPARRRATRSPAAKWPAVRGRPARRRRSHSPAPAPCPCQVPNGQPLLTVRLKTNLRRVAITGIGAVSPNGIGRERFWEATKSGRSGVRRITRFDPTNFLVQVAGEIPDEFDEKKYVEAKDRPHVSRAVPLAAAAVSEALADAQLEPKSMTRDELRGIGVIVGSGGGSQDFTEEQYRLYYTGHQKQCSVYTIPTGTIGTLASEISMRFGFRGLSHIVSTGCTSSTDALGYAFHHIRMGSLSTMI